MKMIRTILVAVLIGFLSLHALANVKPASPFTDNAVLQQGIKVPVWGDADPGEKVTVTFDGKSVSATSDKAGKWKVELAPLTARPGQAPRDLVIAGNDTVTLKNVLVGEVWICSGQSNMDMVVRGAKDAQADVDAADLPQIRMFAVGKAPKPEPQERCAGSWVVCTPQTVGGFSAVGFFFARTVHGELEVPVGMIHTSWSGTPAEPWTSMEFLKKMPVYTERIQKYEQALVDYAADKQGYEQRRADALKKQKQDMAAWMQEKLDADAGMKGKWFDPAVKLDDGKDIAVPMDNRSLQNYSGIVWVRRTVEIPLDWVNSDLTLDLGPIDDCDVTYVNGTEVGGMPADGKSWQIPRIYKVPAKLVTSENVCIAVRMTNTIGAIGMLGSEKDNSLAPAASENARPVALAGSWKYAIGVPIDMRTAPRVDIPQIPGSNPWESATLYNSMITPLVPYAIKGAIWYQGESNAGAPEEYRDLFPAMIASWRQAWGQGDFPFIFVQLANFMARQTLPIETNSWADLRDAQTNTLKTTDTGMAVIIDIGDAEDIHPRNKQDVGKRLALWALAKTYGRKSLVYSGPLYKSMKIGGNKAIVSFDFVGKGLVARGEPLVGFAIAGDDKVLHAAEAAIDGDTVIVKSEKVEKPVAVRYAWANNPICNLYNADGLPASPFRTDTWALPEVKAADEKLSEPAAP